LAKPINLKTYKSG